MGLKEVAEQLIAARAMEAKGKKQKRIFVTNLIQLTDFSDEKIATLADVTVEFVQQMRAELIK